MNMTDAEKDLLVYCVDTYKTIDGNTQWKRIQKEHFPSRAWEHVRQAYQRIVQEKRRRDAARDSASAERQREQEMRRREQGERERMYAEEQAQRRREEVERRSAQEEVERKSAHEEAKIRQKLNALAEEKERLERMAKKDKLKLQTLERMAKEDKVKFEALAAEKERIERMAKEDKWKISHNAEAARGFEQEKERQFKTAQEYLAEKKAADARAKENEEMAQKNEEMNRLLHYELSKSDHANYTEALIIAICEADDKAIKGSGKALVTSERFKRVLFRYSFENAKDPENLFHPKPYTLHDLLYVWRDGRSVISHEPVGYLDVSDQYVAKVGLLIKCLQRLLYVINPESFQKLSKELELKKNAFYDSIQRKYEGSTRK